MSTRLHPFDLLMQLDSDQIHLDCATLHIARDANPGIELSSYLTLLDELANEVANERPGLDSTSRYEAMREVLVNRHDFHGEGHAENYTPDSSYLNMVLDTQRGTPVALSVIWLEVGRRLKWPIAGVGFPNHFLIRFDDPDRFVIADPFNDGRSLSIEDCRDLLAECRDVLDKSLPQPIRLEPEHLSPIDNKTILMRMLNQLRTSYLVRSDWARLAPVLYRLVALEPKNGRHLCELASLHARMGDMKRAYAHLAVYLERIPNDPGATAVRQSMQRLGAAITALN